MSEPKPPALAEFTFKAVAAGIVLGLIFGAANAYLGLRSGLTVAASIPAAVMTVAVFQLLRLRTTILEANLSQTIGSASTSLASGTIFSIPALIMWGYTPSYWQVVALCFLGGVLGLSAMIPLRRLLIVREHDTLPYPEGSACAEVLRATAAGSSGSRWVFIGIGAGAVVKLAVSAFALFPKELELELAIPPKALLAIELAPALLAVGYILGYRQSAICVSGALISALVLTPLIAWLGAGLAQPLFPETQALVRDMSAGAIWAKYVRYVGAGAVAVAGILTVIKNLPSMWGAARSVVGGLRASGQAQGGSRERTDRDLPGWVIVLGVGLVVLASALLPNLLAGEPSFAQRLACSACIAVFGLLFVTVAARIVGLVGVSSQPTSAMILVTVIAVAGLFVGLGWETPAARATVLTVGTIVGVAASKAGDISQDLKTGFLVGATPARQQLGQLIGAACACWAVAGTVLLLGQAYTFGSKELPAAQATLMKTIVEGVLAGDMPWGLVLTGAGLSISAFLCGISPLAFAIGVYLPLATMAPIFVGGCVRALCERGRDPKAARPEGDPGVLAASGMVAGEGLAGVLVAVLVFAGKIDKNAQPYFDGAYSPLLSAAVLLGLCALLWRAGRASAARA